MTSERVRYDVYWTKDIGKKRQTWSSGSLSWNPDNSQVFLYDEDNTQKEGNGFVKGGPTIGKTYPVGQYLVEIRECSVYASTPAPTAKPVAAIGTKLRRDAPSIPPPAKRLPLHPSAAPAVGAVVEIDSANPEASSSPILAPSSSPPQLSQPKTTVPVISSTRFRASVQQPFKRPKRVAATPPQEVAPTSHADFAPSPHATPLTPSKEHAFHEVEPTFVAPPPVQPMRVQQIPQQAPQSPVTPSSSAFMLPWTAFTTPAPQPTAAPSFYQDPPQTVPTDHALDHTASFAVGAQGSTFAQAQAPQNPMLDAMEDQETLALMHAPSVATGSTRVRTFQSMVGNSREASALLLHPGVKRPPPLPPRAIGTVPDLTPHIPLTSSTRLPSQNSAAPSHAPAPGGFAASAASTSSGPALHPSASAPPTALPPPNSAFASSTRSGESPASSPTANRVGSKAKRMRASSFEPASSSSISPSSKPTANAVNSSFKAPTVINPHEAVLGWETKVLCFPSKSTLSRIPKIPRRVTTITPSFSNINDYKKQFSEALFEEINHTLLPLVSRFRDVFSKHASASSAAGNNSFPDASKRKITNDFKHAYFDCTLISHALESSKKGSRYSQRSGAQETSTPSPSTTPTMYLKLPPSASNNQEPSSSFQKDDVWIISSTPSFEPSSPNEFLFLARSTMHGRSPSVMEVKPLAEGSFGSNMRTKLPKRDGEIAVHVLHGPSISSEISMLDCLYDLTPEAMPLLPHILHKKTHQNTPLALLPSLPTRTVDDALRAFLSEHRLNEDQAAVFKRAAAWFKSEKRTEQDPIILVHGVFGSGKSHMLVLLIIFLCELLEQVKPTAADAPEEPVRILVSAATNTAVDRILLGLLEEGFDDFVRVGSLKRINSQILPFSIHRDRNSSGSKGAQDFEANSARSTSYEFSDGAALHDLNDLLKTRGLTSVQRALIEEKILEIKSGQIERKMSLVQTSRVVGATCIATTFPILVNSKFDIVILDECSQMPEPLSLLPTSRFRTRAMLLVGDPLQLPPQLKSKAKSDDLEQEGLGNALFSRLCKMGQIPILLRTQYRLHPALSTLANELFYNNHLINGVTTSDRAPLSAVLPPLLFVNVEDASESVAGGGSVNNTAEANIVSLILQNLLTLGITGAQIGVICLYKSQADLVTSLLTRASSLPHLDHLKDDLASIQISTVDAFQGAEKDVIILSSVRTDSLGFIDSPFRMNVSLTRGRNHLIIVGSAPLLLTSLKWQTVLKAAKLAGPRAYISSHSILSAEYFPALPQP